MVGFRHRYPTRDNAKFQMRVGRRGLHHGGDFITSGVDQDRLPNWIARTEKLFSYRTRKDGGLGAFRTGGLERLCRHARLPIVREVTEVAFLAPSTVGGDSAFEDGHAGYGETSFTPGQRPVSIGESHLDTIRLPERAGRRVRRGGRLRRHGGRGAQPPPIHAIAPRRVEGIDERAVRQRATAALGQPARLHGERQVDAVAPAPRPLDAGELPRLQPLDAVHQQHRH